MLHIHNLKWVDLISVSNQFNPLEGIVTLSFFVFFFSIRPVPVARHPTTARKWVKDVDFIQPAVCNCIQICNDILVFMMRKTIVCKDRQLSYLRRQYFVRSFASIVFSINKHSRLVLYCVMHAEIVNPKLAFIVFLRYPSQWQFHILLLIHCSNCRICSCLGIFSSFLIPECKVICFSMMKLNFLLKLFCNFLSEQFGPFSCRLNFFTQIANITVWPVDIQNRY